MAAKDSGVAMGIDMMTVRDVAEYLRLSQAKVYKLANEGCMPALRIGKAWRFRKDLLDDWIRKQTELTLRVTE